jgi:hypothetical protein
MPGKLCSLCAHKDTATISKEIAAGAPFSEIVFRFGVTKSSVHRHATKCLKIRRRPEATPTKGPKTEKTLGVVRPQTFVHKTSRAGAHEDSRCPTCLQLFGESTDGKLQPKDLIRRSERLLHIAEGIALRADQNDDSRLALLAVDRAERSLSTLLKVHGLLGPEVLVDRRSVTFENAFVGWSEENLRTLKSAIESQQPTAVVKALKGPNVDGSRTQPHQSVRPAVQSPPIDAEVKVLL